MRYLISISYDGSKFNGFQRLNEEKSVQATIERAVSIINKSDVIIKGAGRTDKGVHAYDQKAHFDLDKNIPEEGLKKAINSLVKPYIYINNVEKVSDDFHARFSVVEKTYVYKINLGNYNPLFQDYMNQDYKDLDVHAMIDASKLFLGIHNFKNFVSGERDNYDAIIYSINFNITNNILEIEFIGKSFYRYMVRNLVGALIEVGRKKINKDVIQEMLDNPDISKHLMTAISNGLYLKKIKY